MRVAFMTVVAVLATLECSLHERGWHDGFDASGFEAPLLTANPTAKFPAFRYKGLCGCFGHCKKGTARGALQEGHQGAEKKEGNLQPHSGLLK